MLNLKQQSKDVVYFFKKLYRFAVKMFTYGKLLWYDFDFDYIYLLKLMRLKMQLMSELMEDGMTVSSPVKAKELRLCVNLIDRIINNDYDKLAQQKLTEKYGGLVMKETPYGDHAYTLDIYREKAPKGSALYEQEDKETRKMYENAERQRKQDIDYLFETMKKRLEGWWD